MTLRWTPLAGHHLQSAYDYLVRERPSVADHSIERILSAVQALEHHPRIGRTGRVPGTRELVVTGTPLVVACRIRGGQVEILAVLHGARRWPDRL